MIDIAIEELTKLLIKQDLKDKESGKDEIVVISKVDLIRKSIKLLKMLQ